MAKERAARRAERERLAADEAARRAREAARGARRRSVVEPLRDLVPRRRRPDGLLARRRRSQNLTVATLLVLIQIVVWVGVGSVPVSLWLLVVTVLASPVLLTLIFDRRG